MYDSLAIMLGNPRFPNLDDPGAALAVARKAVALGEEKSRTGTAIAYKTWLGRALISLGEIQSALGDWTGAVASARRAVAWQESLVAADASDVSRKQYLAFALIELGDALAETGRGGDARAAVRRAIDIATRLSRADPANANHRAYLAFAQAVQGDVLRRHGDEAGALESYDASIGLYRGLIASNGVNLQLHLEMAAPCLGAGRVHVARARRSPSGTRNARALPHLVCATEHMGEMQKHFPLTRKQSREQAEVDGALRWCHALEAGTPTGTPKRP